MKKKLPVVIAFLRQFGQKLKKDNITIHSAEAALFVMIAFLPTMILFLTLVNYLPFTVEEAQELSVDFLPEQVSGLVNTLLNEIYQKTTGAVISVASITALWSASRGLLAVIKGLNSVYSVEEKRGFIKLRLVSILYMLAFMVILIVTLVVLVFGGAIARWLISTFPAFEYASAFFSWLRWLFGFCLLVLFFWALYSFAPGRKTRSLMEFPGAIISAAGWVGFSALYSFYITHFANYSYLYGSLTAIVLLMLWLYFCMNILFFGAEVNVLITSRRRKIAGTIKNNLESDK